MDDVGRNARRGRFGVLAIAVAVVLSGCTMVPRSRVSESQRLVQSLRAENARLKDQVLALQAQNRDAADRALDDLRRLTARDQAIEQLERSVESYRDDRDRLAAVYQRLTTNLGRAGDDRTARQTERAPGIVRSGSSAERAGRLGGNGPESLTTKGDGDAIDGSRGDPAAGSGP
jgi:predicted signal transduction protein with EAL and GGDEF domain